MKEPIEGFTPPSGPPQLDADIISEIGDLCDSAPRWNNNSDSLSWELAHLVRNHISIRSAIGFSMELANDYDKILKTSKEVQEIFRAQGAIEALSKFYTALLTDMREAENKETPQ